jgi:hypothetical protein
MAENNWRPLVGTADGVPIFEHYRDGWPHPFEVWTPDEANVRLRQAKDGTWHVFAYKEGGPVLWHELSPLPEGYTRSKPWPPR